MDPPLEKESHSLEQLSKVKQLYKCSSLPIREALFLAAQLVNHGFREATAFIERLSQLTANQMALDYLARLKIRALAIQGLRYLPDIQRNAKLFAELYRTEGWLFLPGAERSETAVVIFTTKFNNFNFSNVVLHALLLELGVSQLFLKDTTKYTFFRGVPRLAPDLPGIPDAIANLLAANGVKRTIVTGFSSGGYPSLYTACALDAAGYVGFSASTDLSQGSPLPQLKMYRDLRDEVPESFQMDLRKLMTRNAPGSKYTFYHGDMAPIDGAHANHLKGIDNVEVVALENCGHQTTSRLLEEGKFLDPFRALCAQ